MAELVKREYRAPDFLADMRDLAGTKPMQELGEGFDILEHTRKAVDWTSGLVDKALGTLGGFVKGVSEAQQANFAKMAQLDPSKGMTKEQLDATIETVIDAATLSPLIAKNVAMKQLSKAFGERKGWIEGMLDAAGRIESPRLRDKAAGEAEQLKRNFPIITKAIRRVNQELLDPITEVGLSPKPGTRGQLNPVTLRADWSVEKGINIEPGSVPHEGLHAVDVKKYRDTVGWTEDMNRRVPPMGYFEARAYPFGDKMEKAMAELMPGEKVSKETYDAILKQVEKETVDRWGSNAFEYDMEEVLKHEFGKRKGASTEDMLKKFAEANDVEFQGRWEDMNGWLLTDRKTKSSSLVRSEDDARKAIAKMRGVKEEDLFELSGWHGGRELEGGKFSAEKVGTGQGLAVGWGTYVSDLEEVGKHYASQAADPAIDYAFRYGEKGEKILSDTMDAPAYKRIALADVNALGKERAIEETVQRLDRLKKLDKSRFGGVVEEAEKSIKFMQEEITGKVSYEKVPGRPGQLHKVTAFKGKAPEEHPWLDWDKPLSEQSEATKKALASFRTDKFDLNPVDGTDIEEGGTAYLRIAEALGSKEAASKALAKAGIAGNRYPTGMFDRRPTPGKYNYVIFEPEAIEIEKSLPFSRKGE